MKLPSLLRQKIERRLARYCERRPFVLNYEKGTVCFTFDDVRHSACTDGAAVLEKHGVHGTFYVCGGLTGTGTYHSETDLQRLLGAGHELACHGFAHIRHQSLTRMEILADLYKNRIFFENIGCDPPQNFAYPYGFISPFSKRVVAHEFVSLRGIRPAINFPLVDLALVKSFPLYQHLWRKTALAQALERNAKVRGLLTFFTHGIVSAPGQFDCSAELLDFAVRMAIASGNRVTSMREALPRHSGVTPGGRASDMPRGSIGRKFTTT